MVDVAALRALAESMVPSLKVSGPARSVPNIMAAILTDEFGVKAACRAASQGLKASSPSWLTRDSVSGNKSRCAMHDARTMSAASRGTRRAPW